MILDTGCQRQVAGKEWHKVHQRHLDQLLPLEYPERASFRFGPRTGKGVQKKMGLPPVEFRGTFVRCGFQKWMFQHLHFAVDTPCLLWEQWVDVARGEIFFRGFNSASQLYLTSSGHLAIRIDEFPTTMPSWPLTPPVSSEYLPDCWAPAVQLVSNRALDRAAHAPQVPDASSTAMASALALLIHLNLFIDQVTMMARLYSSTAIKANLRDRILTTHVLQGPASVMLTSYAAGVMKKEMGMNSYEKDPAVCDHPRTFRNYGAGGVSVKICDVCGFRGVVMPNHSPQAGRMVALTPKGDPNFQDASSHATRRREGAKGTLFKVLLTIIAAAFGKGSASRRLCSGQHPSCRVLRRGASRSTWR